MSTLPNSLIRHIFGFIFKNNEMPSFENINLELEDVFILTQTKNNREKLSKEFFAKTHFWRIKWLNKEMDIGLSDDDNDTPIAIKYNSSRGQLTFVTQYWNYHYPNYNTLAPLKNHNNCEEEYITDERKRSK